MGVNPTYMYIVYGSGPRSRTQEHRSRQAALGMLEGSGGGTPATVVEARFVQPGSDLYEAMKCFSEGGSLAQQLLKI